MNKIPTAIAALALVGTLLGCTSNENSPTTSAQTTSPPPLIPRDVLFGNPERYQGRLSPDATKMSFRAPVDGVMNVWVGDRGDFGSAKPITEDTGRGIATHFWALDSEHVMYIQDQGGDENWHLYSVDLTSGEAIDLSPFDGVQAQMIGQSEAHPGVVVVGMNDRDPKWHDVYRVSLADGERTLLQENPGFGEFYVDNDLAVRLAMKTLPDGSANIMQKTPSGWTQWQTIPAQDVLTTYIVGFDADNEGVYMLDSRNRDKAALVHIAIDDTTDTTPKVIASSEKVDISNVLINPQTHEPMAYALDHLKLKYHATQPDYEPLIKAFNKQVAGGTQVLAQSLDNQYWTVYTNESDSSPVYKVFNTDTGALNELFVTQPEIDNLPLSKMHGVVIPSRDGMELVSYLSIPRHADPDQDGTPEQTSPLVMLVHGGPWARDTYGFNAQAQWLTNRGYSVLQVNYRSSTGFGKAFVNAGNKEWAGAIHNDILDAKDWAVEQGITTADNVAIMGGSYGGYATLVGLTFTPDAFSCGVDIVGPSNLVTLMESIPPYWESFRQVFYNAIGNPEIEAGMALMKERSPLSHVDKITKPLLIAQGANDPRVKQAESDQIVEAMKARDIPVTYVLYPDEGHGFQKPENNLSFFAVAESFLGTCLGGRVQPVGDDFEGSSIEIVHGLDYLPQIGEQMQGTM